jgi:hypothetical protein
VDGLGEDSYRQAPGPSHLVALVLGVPAAMRWRTGTLKLA